MTIFFTADTHFGDHRTINIHKRPFASVAEMDAVGNRATAYVCRNYTCQLPVTEMDEFVKLLQ